MLVRQLAPVAAQADARQVLALEALVPLLLALRAPRAIRERRRGRHRRPLALALALALAVLPLTTLALAAFVLAALALAALALAAFALAVALALPMALAGPPVRDRREGHATLDTRGAVLAHDVAAELRELPLAGTRDLRSGRRPAKVDGFPDVCPVRTPRNHWTGSTVRKLRHSKPESDRLTFAGLQSVQGWGGLSRPGPRQWGPSWRRPGRCPESGWRYPRRQTSA